MSEITMRRLESGYVHIRGVGPCNWAQPPRWPCTYAELDESFFPEASLEFRAELHRRLEADSESPTKETP